MNLYNQFKQECHTEIDLMGRDEKLNELSLQWANHANARKYS